MFISYWNKWVCVQACQVERMRVRNFSLVVKFDKGHIIKDQVAVLAPSVLHWENADLWCSQPAEVCLQTCWIQFILHAAAWHIFLNLRSEHMAPQIEPSMAPNPCRIKFNPLAWHLRPPASFLGSVGPWCHSWATRKPFFHFCCFVSPVVESELREGKRDRWRPGYVLTSQLPGSWESENLHFHLSGKQEMWITFSIFQI